MSNKSKKQKKQFKMLSYQVIISAEISGDKITWLPSEEKISDFFLGFEWKTPLSLFIKRSNFFYSFEFKGESDIYPVIECGVEMSTLSLTKPEFVIEMSVCPSKLPVEKRVLLEKVLDESSSNEDFLIFVNEDLIGSKRLLKDLKSVPEYSGEEDLSPDKCEIFLEDALKFFEFDSMPSEEAYKKKLREFQLKFHPDMNEGQEDQFLKFQKYKKLIDEELL